MSRLFCAISLILLLSLIIPFATTDVVSAPAAQLILFWDDNSSSSPSGWTCISDGSGEDFFEMFPRGAPTYGGSGGNSNHAHTASPPFSCSGPSGTPTTNLRYSWLYQTVSSATHSHTIYSCTVLSASNLPERRGLRVIRCDAGIPSTTIPAGAIALFDSTPLPSGWTQYSAQNGYFVQGAPLAGITLGSNTHDHFVTISMSGATGGNRVGFVGYNAPLDGHAHSTGTTDSGSNEPPYREVILAKANSDTSLPAGMIGMFNEPPPACWTVISDTGGDLHHRFIKGSNSYGATGGAESHSHATITTNITLLVTNAWTNRTIWAASPGHTHNVTAYFSTDSHLPPYRDVIFAKLRIVTASASSNSPVCEDSTINLFGSASGGTEPCTYSWLGPGGWSSNDQNPTRSDATTGMTGTYSLTVTDNNGCSSIPATTEVTVNPKPIAQPSSNSPVCQGGTIQLSGGPNGMQTYNWFGPGGWISTDQNPTRSNATTDMTGTYSLTVTDNNTCTSDPATTDVTVNPKPIAQPSSNSPVCEDSTINLSGSASGGTEPYTYSWSGPGGWSSTDQNPTRSNATTDMTGTYSLTVTDNKTCTSNPATTDVTVSPPPSVACSASAFLSFLGSQVGFSCAPSGGLPPYNYLWDFGDGSTSTEQNPDHIYTGVGTFGANVTVTDSIGCIGTCSTDVTVIPLASPEEAASLPAALSPPPTPRSSPGPPFVPHQLSHPNLTVQFVSVNPQQGYAGQPVTISTNVVNTGDEGGNYNVVLKINGKVEQSKMVSVGPQGTQPVKFTLSKSQSGSYTVDVGGQRSSFTILGAKSKSTAPPTRAGLIAILVMVILVLATAVVLLLGFRRAA